MWRKTERVNREEEKAMKITRIKEKKKRGKNYFYGIYTCINVSYDVNYWLKV